MTTVRQRCPECGSTSIEQTCMGGPIMPRRTKLDVTNTGTCICGFKAQVAVFQLVGVLYGECMLQFNGVDHIAPGAMDAWVKHIKETEFPER